MTIFTNGITGKLRSAKPAKGKGLRFIMIYIVKSVSASIAPSHSKLMKKLYVQTAKPNVERITTKIISSNCRMARKEGWTASKKPLTHMAARCANVVVKLTSSFLPSITSMEKVLAIADPLAIVAATTFTAGSGLTVTHLVTRFCVSIATSLKGILENAHMKPRTQVSGF